MDAAGLIVYESQAFTDVGESCSHITSLPSNKGTFAEVELTNSSELTW